MNYFGDSTKLRQPPGYLKIAWVFVLAIVTLAVASGYAYFSFVRLTQANNWVFHTQEVQENLRWILEDALDAEGNSRAYRLTHDDLYWSRFQLDQTNVVDHLHRLAGLVADNPLQKTSSLELAARLKDRLDHLEESMNLARTNDLGSLHVDRIRVGNQLMDAVRTKLNEMLGEENRLLARRKELAESEAKDNLHLVIFLGTVSLAFLSAAAVFSIRVTRQRRQAQKDLQTTLADLERRVQLRTAELRNSNAALTVSEEKFSKTFRNSPLAFSISTLDEGMILDVNDAFLTLHGYASRADLVGKTTLQLGFWNRPEERQQVMLALKMERRILNLKRRFRRADGTEGTGLYSLEAMEIAGQPCLLAVLNDITERERTENALRLSELKFSHAFANNAAAIALTRLLDGVMIEVNETWEHLTGYSRAEIIGKSARFMWPTPADARQFVEALQESDRILAREQTFLNKAGQTYTVELSARKLIMEGETMVLSTLVDISQRKRIEAEREVLVEQLLVSEDMERRRIAREMHDSTAQVLAALKLNLTSLKKHWPDTGQAQTIGETLLADSLALTDEAVKEIRNFSWLLHPPLLDELGLGRALMDFADGFSRRSQIQVVVECSRYHGRLPAAREMALFRVAQEALSNILRHSQSPTAIIRLERDEQEVRLEIQDSGRGMSPEALRTGVGISSMRERMRLIGGLLSVESDREGTTILATLPLTKES